MGESCVRVSRCRWRWWKARWPRGALRGKLGEYALLRRLAEMGFGVETKREMAGEPTVAGPGFHEETEMKRASKIEGAARLYRFVLFEEATDVGVSEKGRVLSKGTFWKVLEEF